MTAQREPDLGSTVIRHRWEHHEVSGWGGFDCSCSRASFQEIINIMHTAAARCFWKPKWPWVKTKPPKPAKPSTTGRAVCNARFLLREVHVSGALSGACTGKGPQIANPRPTPKPGNLGPPWPPGTSGDPAGYSRGRPLGGSRLLPWHRRSSYEPDAPARGVPQSPRWRVGLVCARMRNFLAGVISLVRSGSPGADAARL